MRHDTRIGAILRAYATDESKYASLAEQLEVTATQLCQVGIEHVVISVWDSGEFYGHCDYGGTYIRLLQLFENVPNITVFRNTGDNFVDGPSHSMRLLAKKGCTHGLIASTGVVIDVSEFIKQAKVAIAAGALVVAAPVAGTEELVAQGFVNNAWCLWNLQSVSSVGYFDIRDSGPAHSGDAYGNKVLGFKPYAGVAEALLLPRLWHECQHPFVWVVDQTVGYHVSGDPEAAKRQGAKNASKHSRIKLMLDDTSLQRSDFICCVMQKR